MSRFSCVLVALSSVSVLVLVGCGAATSFSNPTDSTKVVGKVFGGQQPITGSTVTVWSAGITGYGSAPVELAETATLDDGSFSFDENAYSCVAGEQVYLTAAGGNTSPDHANPNIMLAAGLGDCASAKSAVVELNEVSTVATAFALAQFYTLNIGGTGGFGTAAADLPAFTLSNESTIPMLVDIPTGTVKPNTAGVRIEAAKIYTMANILAACVNDAADFANCNTLFQNTIPIKSGAQAPVDTLQAAVQMALYPYQNIQTLYQLASSKPPFVGLSTQPNDFTLGVSYTSSDYALSVVGSIINNAANGAPADELSPTSATIDIDASGRVWFPTNLTGHAGVAYFDPGSMAFNGPYITGLVGPQYVAIDNGGTVWVDDVSGPNFGYMPTASPVAATPGHSFDGLLSMGPLAGDGLGNMVLANVDQFARPGLIKETAGAYAYLNSEQALPSTGITEVVNFNGDDTNFTIGSGTGTACVGEWFYDSAGDEELLFTTASPCVSGGIAFTANGIDTFSVASSLNTIYDDDAEEALTYPIVNLPEGIATDGSGTEWVANSGNASVTSFGLDAAISPVAYLHDAADGDTMTTPYAIAIDGSGNVWVANAGCVTITATSCTPGPFVLSELIGAAAPTIAPLSLQMVDGAEYVGYPPGTVFGDPAARAHASGAGSSTGPGKARSVPAVRQR